MNLHTFYIYSNCDFSSKSAATTRMVYYAKALAGDGHKVYLVSCCSTKFSDENFVEIAPNVFVLEHKKLTRNFFHIISFLRRLDVFSKEKTGKRTFLLYPFPFVFLELLTVVYLKIYKNRTVFYELNEVRKYSSSFHSPLSLKNIKYSFQKILYKTVLTLIEPTLYFFDGLICISTQIEKYGQRFNKNTLRVPILTDPHMEAGISEKIYFTETHFNIGFSGSIIPSKENLVEFVQTINKITQQGIKVTFNLCGGIKDDDYNLLIDLADNSDTIKYYGILGENELSAFLSQQNLLVIPRGYNQQNKYGFSTKLSDYLNHKKMILVTDISDNGLFVKDEINGFIVPPNNPEAMYKKLMHIIQDFESLEKSIISNAYKISENEFNYRLFTQPLRKFLKKYDYSGNSVSSEYLIK